MFTGKNRKEFHFIATPECISHFIKPVKHVFQPCRLSCGSENPRGEFSSIPGPSAKTLTSWKEQLASPGKGEVRWRATAAPPSRSRPVLPLTWAPVEVTLFPVIHTVKHIPVKLWFLTAHLGISSRMNLTYNCCSAVFILFHLHARFPHWTPQFFARLLKFSASLLLLNAACSCSLPPVEVNASQQTISHGWNKRTAPEERKWKRGGKQERCKSLSFELCSHPCFSSNALPACQNLSV